MDAAQIMSESSLQIIDDLWMDYQIIGIFAGNPLFPIEPLTTYGDLLGNARTLKKSLHEIIKLEPALLSWKDAPGETDLLPLVQTVFLQIKKMITPMREARESLRKLVSPSENSLQLIDQAISVSESLSQYESTWTKIL